MMGYRNRPKNKVSSLLAEIAYRGFGRKFNASMSSLFFSGLFVPSHMTQFTENSDKKNPDSLALSALSNHSLKRISVCLRLTGTTAA